MAGVRLVELRKAYDSGPPAVDGVSLDVPDGEFTVLVGPSGCGKTTLLRLVAGLEEPSAGAVWIGDRDVTGLAPAERDVAMVFQSYALYPHLNVRENIGFGLRMRHVPGATISIKVRDAAAMLGLAELLERKPAQLSGGQRQRVALARAIVREPRVFLFDEPLSNLDAQVRAQTRAELVRLHRRLGATMLYVTHDQVEAMTMAQRVAVMDRGRVQQVASPMMLYRDPTTLFVASFIGSPPINRFLGRVERVDGATRFVGALECELSAAPMPRAVLGVRPEHLMLGRAGESTGGTVVLIEPLGPESHVRVQLAGGVEAVSRVAGSPALAIGDTVSVAVAPGAALLFDADDGRRLA